MAVNPRTVMQLTDEQLKDVNELYGQYAAVYVCHFCNKDSFGSSALFGNVYSSKCLIGYPGKVEIFKICKRCSKRVNQFVALLSHEAEKGYK